MNVRLLVRAVGVASLCLPVVVAAATWTGHVIDKSTRLPVVRAAASMSNAQTVLTDNRGAFQLSTIPVSIPQRPITPGWDPSRRVLSLWLEHAEPVRLDVRSLSGRLVARPFDGLAPEGKWTWDASSLPAGTGVVVLVLHRGGRTESWTMLPRRLGAQAPMNTETAGRAEATTDSISVAAAGFFPAKVAAPATTSDLDTVWLTPNPAGGYIVWNDKVRYGSFVDPRDGRHYRTIAWKDRIWMAQNLNHVPPTADSGSCYSGNKDFCEKFGRHYTWKEATGGATMVRGAYSRQGHLQGICPEGWFLLGMLDWALFADFDRSSLGWLLKSTTGWSGGGNGRDTLGMRLLPSGWRSAAGTFANAGTGTFLWQGDVMQDGSRDGRLITGTDSFVTWVSVADEKALSVRCARGRMDTLLTHLSVVPNKNGPTYPSFIDKMGPLRYGVYSYKDTVDASLEDVVVQVKGLDSLGAALLVNGDLAHRGGFTTEGELVDVVKLGSQGTTTPVRVVVKAPDGDSLVYRVDVHRLTEPAPAPVPFSPRRTFGTLVDARDNATYRTIVIGEKKWMAENLAFVPGGPDDSSRCQADSPDSCLRYGRLYTLNQVLGGMPPSGRDVSGIRGVCPAGWHLPSTMEWWSLFTSANGEANAGWYLKAPVGWGTLGAGVDSMGFRALPGGRMSRYGFHASGIEGHWWASSGTSNSTQVKVGMSRYTNAATLAGEEVTDSLRLSVRCVEDP